MIKIIAEIVKFLVDIHEYDMSKGNVFHSKVNKHEGKCFATWLNYNRVDNMQDNGRTGYFKNSISGEKFHGIIRFGTRTVLPTGN